MKINFILILFCIYSVQGFSQILEAKFSHDDAFRTPLRVPRVAVPLSPPPLPVRFTTLKRVLDSLEEMHRNHVLAAGDIKDPAFRTPVCGRDRASVSSFSPPPLGDGSPKSNQASNSLPKPVDRQTSLHNYFLPREKRATRALSPLCAPEAGNVNDENVSPAGILPLSASAPQGSEETTTVLSFPIPPRAQRPAAPHSSLSSLSNSDHLSGFSPEGELISGNKRGREGAHAVPSSGAAVAFHSGEGASGSFESDSDNPPSVDLLHDNGDQLGGIYSTQESIGIKKVRSSDTDGSDSEFSVEGNSNNSIEKSGSIASAAAIPVPACYPDLPLSPVFDTPWDPISQELSQSGALALPSAVSPPRAAGAAFDLQDDLESIESYSDSDTDSDPLSVGLLKDVRPRLGRRQPTPASIGIKKVRSAETWEFESEFFVERNNNDFTVESGSIASSEASPPPSYYPPLLLSTVSVPSRKELPQRTSQRSAVTLPSSANTPRFLHFLELDRYFAAVGIEAPPASPVKVVAPFSDKPVFTAEEMDRPSLSSKKLGTIELNNARAVISILSSMPLHNLVATWKVQNDSRPAAYQLPFYGWKSLGITKGNLELKTCELCGTSGDSTMHLLSHPQFSELGCRIVDATCTLRAVWSVEKAKAAARARGLLR